MLYLWVRESIVYPPDAFHRLSFMPWIRQWNWIVTQPPLVATPHRTRTIWCIRAPMPRRSGKVKDREVNSGIVLEQGERWKSRRAGWRTDTAKHALLHVWNIYIHIARSIEHIFWSFSLFKSFFFLLIYSLSDNTVDF